jgi:hypothetical protein
MIQRISRIALGTIVAVTLMVGTAVVALADPGGETARGSGSIGTYQDFSFSAKGDPYNLGATGSIKVTYPGSDPNQQFSGDIDCLNLVSPNRAIMSGPLTRVQHGDPYWQPTRFIAFAEDNGPNGGSSSNPDRFNFQPIDTRWYGYPPPDCRDESYVYGSWINKGDVDIDPGR